MADVFPNTIITILTEEYSEFSKKGFEDEEHEIRLKLGEVLVRVTKTLGTLIYLFKVSTARDLLNFTGDMASKYKAMLLNAFLNSVKDDDHLIRTSSLSNLGEVCRVLGYKLGSIIAEVGVACGFRVNCGV